MVESILFLVDASPLFVQLAGRLPAPCHVVTRPDLVGRQAGRQAGQGDSATLP